METIDDLMVTVMLRSDDESLYAVVQLIQMVEQGQVTAEQCKLVSKAASRRKKRARGGSDLYDLLSRLETVLGRSL